MNKESIVLGSGDLYCTDFLGTDKEIPADEEIEKEENRLGHIKAGAQKTIWGKCQKLLQRKRKLPLNPG